MPARVATPKFLTLLAVLAIGAAVAWYLISPLFIRTTLVDRASAPTAGPAARGSFNEIDAIHKGRGQALLFRNPDGRLTVHLEEFSVTNGPDLYVYLSRQPEPRGHDQVVDGLNLGRLKATDGAFSYETDVSADPAEFKSVVVYCYAFRTVFSYATLH